MKEAVLKAQENPKKQALQLISLYEIFIDETKMIGNYFNLETSFHLSKNGDRQPIQHYSRPSPFPGIRQLPIEVIFSGLIHSKNEPLLIEALAELETTRDITILSLDKKNTSLKINALLYGI